MISGDAIAQIVIAFTGVTAVWLSQCRSISARKWAPVLGIIGQPAWFFTTIVNGQFGMVLLCVIYTLAWIRGLRNHWFTPDPSPRP